MYIKGKSERKKIEILDSGLWNLMLILRAMAVSTRGAISHKTGTIPHFTSGKTEVQNYII